MALDFSQEAEAPIITTSLIPGDAQDATLRPQTLAEYTGQEKAKGNLSVYIEAAAGVSRWIMYCSMALPDWEKPPLPV